MVSRNKDKNPTDYISLIELESEGPDEIPILGVTSIVPLALMTVHFNVPITRLDRATAIRLSKKELLKSGVNGMSAVSITDLNSSESEIDYKNFSRTEDDKNYYVSRMIFDSDVALDDPKWVTITLDRMAVVTIEFEDGLSEEEKDYIKTMYKEEVINTELKDMTVLDIVDVD